MTRYQIDAYCDAITRDITNSYARSQRRRYANRFIYNFLSAYKSITGKDYAGEVELADLSDAIRAISGGGVQDELSTIGAPLAYMRQRSDKSAATFADYSSWIRDYAVRQSITH